MSRILVDLDGVIADWGAEYDSMLDSFGEEAAGIPRHADQRTFNLNEGRTAREKVIIHSIMCEPGFYSRLTLLPGARNALHEMRDAGHDVRIVTSPFISNPTCASDKLNWIMDRLGQSWAQRTIITTDKTLVRGNYLIDDRPVIIGAASPMWDHVVLTQPYNLHITDKLRLDSLAEWKELF